MFKNKKYQEFEILVQKFYEQIEIDKNLLKKIENQIVIKGEFIVFLNDILRMTASFIGIVDSLFKIINTKKEVVK